MKTINDEQAEFEVHDIASARDTDWYVEAARILGLDNFKTLAKRIRVVVEAGINSPYRFADEMRRRIDYERAEILELLPPPGQNGIVDSVYFAHNIGRDSDGKRRYTGAFKIVIYRVKRGV